MDRPSRRITHLSVLVALLLVAAACGDDDASETAATSAHNCPEKIVILIDWFPQPDPGGIYNLIGPDGEQDALNGIYRGPIQAKYAEPYGDSVPIIEIRGDGSVFNTAAELYVDDSITFVQQQSDLAVQFSQAFPTLGVVATLDTHPAVVMWDPLDFPGATTIKEISDGGATFLMFDAWSAWLMYQIDVGNMTMDQVDASYFGGPDRFIAEDKIAQQAFATDEIYRYQFEFEEYGREIAYQFVHDTGFEWYPGSGTLRIRPEDKDELDSCLKLFVPTVQQSAIDYMTDDWPGVNAALVQLVDDMASFWTMSEASGEYSVRMYHELGLFNNGSDGDDTLGNWDLTRIQNFIDILIPILAEAELDTFDPDLKAEDLVTNEYIDPSISLSG